MSYLAFDPGKTTGWCLFDEHGQEIDFGQCEGDEQLIAFLESVSPPEIVICEDFKLFGHLAKQQTGSKFEASQVIGIIKYFCNKWQVPLKLQPSSILPIAQLWSGVKVEGKGGHEQSHWKSAFNHGVYYLQKEGIRKSRLKA